MQSITNSKKVRVYLSFIVEKIYRNTQRLTAIYFKNEIDFALNDFLETGRMPDCNLGFFFFLI